MVLQRNYPLRGFRRTEYVFDRFWSGLGSRYWARPYITDRVAPLDVEERDDSVIVRVSLPGAAPDDVRVTTEDGVLHIETGTAEESDRGTYLIRERRHGSFHRSLRLPETVDTEKAEAGYEHGVLTVSFPKLEAKKAKRIEVKVAS